MINTVKYSFQQGRRSNIRDHTGQRIRSVNCEILTKIGTKRENRGKNTWVKPCVCVSGHSSGGRTCGCASGRGRGIGKLHVVVEQCGRDVCVVLV